MISKRVYTFKLLKSNRSLNPLVWEVHPWMIEGKAVKSLRASLKAPGKAQEIILRKNSLESSFKTKIRRCLTIGSSNLLFRAFKKMNKLLRTILLMIEIRVSVKEGNLKVKFLESLSSNLH